MDPIQSTWTHPSVCIAPCCQLGWVACSTRILLSARNTSNYSSSHYATSCQSSRVQIDIMTLVVLTVTTCRTLCSRIIWKVITLSWPAGYTSLTSRTECGWDFGQLLACYNRQFWPNNAGPDNYRHAIVHCILHCETVMTFISYSKQTRDTVNGVVSNISTEISKIRLAPTIKPCLRIQVLRVFSVFTPTHQMLRQDWYSSGYFHDVKAL